MKCKSKNGGCFLGRIFEQDDSLDIDEFQYKHLGKNDKKRIEWFTYCPNCGTKIDKGRLTQ